MSPSRRPGRIRTTCSFFPRLLDEGRRILRPYCYPTFEPGLPHPYIQEHEAIIAAIAARDVDTCDRLAKEHADSIVQQIQDMLARDLQQGITL